MIGLATVLAIAFAVWWLTNPRISDKQQIENLVAKVEHGVESKSGREIMECVAPDYKDSNGLDRLEILKLVNSWVRSPEQADITVEKYEIKINGRSATGHFDVQLYLQEDGRGQPPTWMSVEVSFEKQWRRLRQVWRVKAVEGPSLSSAPEDYL